MAELLVAVLAGVAGGVAVTWVLLRRSAAARAHDRFTAWCATDRVALRRRAVRDGRGGVKQEVGRDLAEVADLFPFEASDVRFVGDPVTFVVFDGHTEVKDRAGTALRGVAFVTVTDGAADGAAEGADDSFLVAECVAAGRVEWLTLKLP